MKRITLQTISLLLVAVFSVLVPTGASAQNTSTATLPAEHPNTSSVAQAESKTIADRFENTKIDIQRRIKRAYFPPKSNESHHIVVQFHVHRHGELSNLHVVLSSGIFICDQAALKAVENAAPFRPLPEGAKDEEAFEMTFDYNVFADPQGQAIKHLPSP